MKSKILRITEIAIFAALGCTLDILGTVICIFVGSGFAIVLSVIPISLASYKWGIGPGIIVGLLTGLLEMIFQTFLGGAINILQSFLEYPVALLIFGLCGIYRKEVLNKQHLLFDISVPLLILFAIKLIIHSVAARFYWGIPEFWQALVLNIPYIAISFFVAVPVIYVCALRLNKYLNKGVKNEDI